MLTCIEILNETLTKPLLQQLQLKIDNICEHAHTKLQSKQNVEQLNISKHEICNRQCNVNTVN